MLAISLYLYTILLGSYRDSILASLQPYLHAIMSHSWAFLIYLSAQFCLAAYTIPFSLAYAKP
jgi:hypothetical protein